MHPVYLNLGMEFVLNKKMKLNNFKKFVLGLLFYISFYQTATAQEGIDTAMVREMNIKKVSVFVKLPILPNKTINDSCLLEIHEWDTAHHLIYQYNNMRCYGWGELIESYHTYDQQGRLEHTKQEAQGRITFIHYTYNPKGDIIKIVQSSPLEPDTFFTYNEHVYTKKGKVAQSTSKSIYTVDTTINIIKYTYDDADNLKEINTYTGDSKLIQKESFDITPVSKKLLEFSTEVKLPKPSFTKGWNYYNFDALLIKTQFSNNTWTDYEYSENGLLYLSKFYNMEGKLNSQKSYFYQFNSNAK